MQDLIPQNEQLFQQRGSTLLSPLGISPDRHKCQVSSYCRTDVAIHFNLLSDGKITEDGSNNIMLSFGNDRHSYYKYLLGVNYAAMWPVKSNFRLPVTKKLDVIGKLLKHQFPAYKRDVLLNTFLSESTIAQLSILSPLLKFGLTNIFYTEVRILSAKYYLLNFMSEELS